MGFTNWIGRKAKCWASAILVCTALWGHQTTPAATTPPLNSQQPESGQDIRQLEPGAVLEAKIGAAQAHNYKLSIRSGQFISVIVEQRALGLSVILYAPDGSKLAGEYQSQLWASHLIAFVAQASGEYRLEIRVGASPPTAKSTYRVRVSETKVGGENERRRAEGARLWLEAHDVLRQQLGSAASQQLAATKYAEALGLFQAAGDRYGEALVLADFSYNAFSINEKSKAFDFMQQALSSWRSLGEVQHQASLLWGWAPLYNQSDQRERGTEYFKEALALARRLNDRQLEIWILTDMPSDNPRDPFGRLLEVVDVAQDAGLPEEEATALANIASIYSSLGESNEAINYLMQAREIFRKIGETDWEGRTLSGIGSAYASQGNYQAAIDHFNLAIPLMHAAKRPNPEAGTMNALAEAYERLGAPEKAIESYGKVAELNKTSTVSILNPYARSRVGLAQVLTARGERNKAIELLNEALELATKYPPYLATQRGNLYLRIGLAFDKLREGDQTLEAFRKALEAARAIKSSGDEAAALYEIARVQRNSGQLTDARANAESAIQIIESKRLRIGDPQLRASYLSTVRQRYDLLTDILMRAHQQQPNAGLDALALQNSERARARVLLDMLREARAEIRQGVDAKLLALETRLRQTLNAKAQQQTNLLMNKAAPQQLTAIDNELRQLNIEYQQVETEIRAKSPHYANLTQPQIFGAKEIQDQVLEPNTALVEYQLGDERSYVWVLTKDHLASFELPGRAKINKAALRTYELLTARQRRPLGETPAQRQARVALADREYPTAALALSQMILAPAIGGLKTRRLLIVADGALQYVPFAALPSPQSTQPLIADYEIVMLPSASVLAALRKETNGRASAPRTIVTLADPVFDKDDPRVHSKPLARNAGRTTARDAAKPTSADNNKSLDLERTLRGFTDDETGNPLSRLPFTRDEAKAILSVASPGSTMTATDFKASRLTAIDPQLSQYRIVHFATHALLNAQRPELSGVVFSLVDEKGLPQDGFVRLNEIYNLNLPADLVVLSACQTALGKDVNGEGLVGLTRGFMYSGAPRVMASLWNINDSVTADMMKRFYREMLTKGASPAAALRESQLQMLRQKQRATPYYWSAFVLQGEYR
jgi:CHAT domain-containing protein